jgi:hypothetical protein
MIYDMVIYYIILYYIIEAFNMNHREGEDNKLLQNIGSYIPTHTLFFINEHFCANLKYHR